MSNTISILSREFLQARDYAPQCKMAEHLPSKTEIGIAITIVFVVHESHVAEAIFRRIRNCKTIKNLKGSYTSPFIRNLCPVEVLEHAQIVPTSSPCTIF